jgi:hypothetical protein
MGLVGVMLERFKLGEEEYGEKKRQGVREFFSLNEI